MRVKSKSIKGKSILVKLVLILLLLSIISGATILGVALNEQKRNMENKLIQENKQLAQVAARSIEAGYVKQTWPFRTLNQINDSEDVLFWWIVKPDGEIYLADNPNMHGRGIGNASVLVSSEADETIVRDYVYSGENIKFLVQPLNIGEPGKIWSLCIGISLKSVNAAAKRMVITSLGYFSLIIAFACLLSLFLAIGFTKPIMQLVKGTEAISKGDFDTRVKIKTGDEIEGLGTAFNKMAEQVKQGMEKIQASLQEKEELLREIHHRVKNNLQIISSLLDMQAMRVKDKELVNSLSDSRGRIQTMSLIHAHLYQSENLEQVEMGTTIRKLVNFLLQIYAKDGKNITIVITTEDVILPISQAIPCALIINELVSNALKHAFKGMTKGIIEVSMRELDERVELIVKDNGAGIPEDFDIYKTKTLGLRLVRTLAEDQLKGEMKLNREEGTKFYAEFDKSIKNDK